MSKLELYGQVRVTKLVRESHDYDNWNNNQYSPKVGEVGYLIDVLEAEGVPPHYLVEKSDPETGFTLWLSEFLEEEIEPLVEAL